MVTPLADARRTALAARFGAAVPAHCTTMRACIPVVGVPWMVQW